MQLRYQLTMNTVQGQLVHHVSVGHIGCVYQSVASLCGIGVALRPSGHAKTTALGNVEPLESYFCSDAVVAPLPLGINEETHAPRQNVDRSAEGTVALECLRLASNLVRVMNTKAWLAKNFVDAGCCQRALAE